ncbi:MAG: hypothetical protein NVS1B4_00370 [Gemmatimonadaceae bacterium]
MRAIIMFNGLVAMFAGVGAATLGAQEPPVRRISSIVGVVVEEYAKAVDGRGRLVSATEYQEARDFLADARQAGERLSGARADAARAVLDSIVDAVGAHRPPQVIAQLHTRFTAALGAEGALQMPVHPLNATAGRTLYQAKCANCHGETGLGDGPAAHTLSTPAAPIGSAVSMHGRTPALLYRVISVGVAGTAMPAWATTLSADDRWNIVTYLHTLRATPPQVKEGEGLYLQRCSQCHGVTGMSDGVASRALTSTAPQLASLAWQAERSDAQLATAVRHGIAGTAMPGAPELSTSQLAAVVGYMRLLPTRTADRMVMASGEMADSVGPVRVSRRVVAILNEALAASQGGRLSDAGDRAFDAYIAFEPLESTARARNPGLVATMEKYFADFKGAVRSSDLRSAERTRDAIESGLPKIVALAKPTGSGWAAFIESFLIILREGFEVILVIGAVVAFLIKTGHRDRLRAIWTGAALGMVASAVTAVVLNTLLSAMPASREIIEGTTLLVAVGVLFSVSYWLISKVEAAKWQQFIKEKVTNALEHGGGRALGFVAFLAVYREGAETALFYQALFNEGAQAHIPLALGIIAGFVILAVVFTGFYRFGVRIPLRPFFGATSGLLYIMAFVFTGRGIRELQEANTVSLTPVSWLPHVEALGMFPTVETLLAQLVLLLLFLFAIAKTFWPRRSVTLPTVAAPPNSVVAEDLAPQLTELQERNRTLERRVDALETSMRDERTPVTGIE